MRRIFGLGVVAVLVLAACGKYSNGPASGGSPSQRSSAGTATLAVNTLKIPGVGTVLVDSGGFTLYHLQGETTSTLKCTGSCLSTWPPLLDNSGATASGGRWSYAGVRSILLGSPNGRKRGTPLIAGGANWSPIIDTDRLALVPARWPKAPEGERPGRRRGVLSGVAVCGECGHRMFRSADYYRCNVSNGGCGQVSVKAFTLEQWVVWTTANMAPIGNDPPPDEAVDVEPILARLRELEERARAIEESIASGEMPVRIGAKAAARLETERQTVEAELASAPGYRRSLPRVDFTKRDEATGLPVEADVGDLRAFVSHFVERVIVQRPRRRRSRPEERSEIIWRRPEIMLDRSPGS